MWATNDRPLWCDRLRILLDGLNIFCFFLLFCFPLLMWMRERMLFVKEFLFEMRINGVVRHFVWTSNEDSFHFSAFFFNLFMLDFCKRPGLSYYDSLHYSLRISMLCFYGIYNIFLSFFYFYMRTDTFHGRISFFERHDSIFVSFASRCRLFDWNVNLSNP